MKLTNNFWPRYALLLACSLLATYPLLQDGFFKGGDFTWEIVRVPVPA